MLACADVGAACGRGGRQDDGSRGWGVCRFGACLQVSSELTLVASITAATTSSTAATTSERTTLNPAGTHTLNSNHTGQDRSRVSTLLVKTLQSGTSSLRGLGAKDQGLQVAGQAREGSC